MGCEATMSPDSRPDRPPSSPGVDVVRYIIVVHGIGQQEKNETVRVRTLSARESEVSYDATDLDD